MAFKMKPFSGFKHTVDDWGNPTGAHTHEDEIHTADENDQMWSDTFTGGKGGWIKKSPLEHITQDVNHDHTGDGTVDDPTATGSDNPMYQQGKKRLPPMSTSPFGPLFP